MKRLTVALALTLTLSFTGTASAHRQTCNQHVHPQIGRLTRLGFKCVQGANWVNRVRYVRCDRKGCWYQDVRLVRHSEMGDAWSVGPMIRKNY